MIRSAAMRSSLPRTAVLVDQLEGVQDLAGVRKLAPVLGDQDPDEQLRAVDDEYPVHQRHLDLASRELDARLAAGPSAQRDLPRADDRAVQALRGFLSQPLQEGVHLRA